MIHVGADGECLYVDLYMNYNEVHNRLHVDRFRFRAKTTPFSTRLNANTYYVPTSPSRSGDLVNIKSS